MSVGDRWRSNILGSFARLWAVAIALRSVLCRGTILSRSSTNSSAYLIFSSACWSARRPSQCYVYKHDWTQRIDDVDPDVWANWRSRGDIGTYRARFHRSRKSLCHISLLYFKSATFLIWTRDLLVKTNRCVITMMFVHLSVCLGQACIVIMWCILTRT